jgi:hypothetical protein
MIRKPDGEPDLLTLVALADRFVGQIESQLDDRDKVSK